MSEVNAAMVKSNAQVAMNKNSDPVQRGGWEDSANFT